MTRITGFAAGQPYTVTVKKGHFPWLRRGDNLEYIIVDADTRHELVSVVSQLLREYRLQCSGALIQKGNTYTQVLVFKPWDKNDGDGQYHSLFLGEE